MKFKTTFLGWILFILNLEYKFQKEKAPRVCGAWVDF